jgi:hypothetical protein
MVPDLLWAESVATSASSGIQSRCVGGLRARFGPGGVPPVALYSLQRVSNRVKPKTEKASFYGEGGVATNLGLRTKRWSRLFARFVRQPVPIRSTPKACSVSERCRDGPSCPENRCFGSPKLGVDSRITTRSSRRSWKIPLRRRRIRTRQIPLRPQPFEAGFSPNFRFRVKPASGRP